MAVVVDRLTEDWATLPWEQFERNVYRLQRRIYRAARCGDRKRVHDLQQLRCGLRFTVDDLLEVHHKDGNRTNNGHYNLVLLHGHCHDQTHGRRCQ